MTDHPTLAPTDAYELAEKIIEMADRAKRAHLTIPGATALWHFESEQDRFRVEVSYAGPAEEAGDD